MTLTLSGVHVCWRNELYLSMAEVVSASGGTTPRPQTKSERGQNPPLA